jgi:hypothetical protein
MTRNRPTKSAGRQFQAPKVNLKIETVKRIIIFSLAALILGAAQCSFFPILDICPRTPDLIMGLILATALCDNAKTAMALSVGAGFFIDAIGGGAFALSPMLYFIYAIIMSAASQKVLNSFPAFILLMLPSLIFRAASTVLLTLLYSGAISGGIISTLLLEALCTFILCLPIYPIMALATKPLSAHTKFKF